MAATKNTKTFYNSEVPRDWSSPEFGDVFNFLKTFSFSREQLTSKTTTDEIRNIHYGDIHATYENEILDFEIEKTVPYLLDGTIDAKSFEDENFPSLKEGDLIIADASEDYEGVCDCVELKNVNGAKVVSGLHTFAARASKDKIALGYRTYALQHEQVIRELRRIATGTSVYGVSKTNLSKVKIPLPPISEQKAIAQVLSTADAAIHTTEKIIAQKELRKKWLMQHLLTGKKRLKGFSWEWEDIELGELLDYEQPTKYLVKDTLYDDSYSTPVLTAGKTFILGYTNENDGICKDLPVIIFDDFTTASKFIDFPFKAKSSAMKLLRPKQNVNLKFVYEAMQLINYTVGGHERHWISKFVYLTIPCPPLEEQTAIAEVLQTADKEINLLKTKATKLREQKKGLMQQLLTGKVRLKLNN